MAKLSETYENKMERLTQIVHGLEQGDLSLEENLKAYQEGMELYQELKSILEEKQGIVKKITAETDPVDFELLEDKDIDFQDEV